MQNFLVPSLCMPNCSEGFSSGRKCQASFDISKKNQLSQSKGYFNLKNLWRIGWCCLILLASLITFIYRASCHQYHHACLLQHDISLVGWLTPQVTLAVIKLLTSCQVDSFFGSDKSSTCSSASKSLKRQTLKHLHPLHSVNELCRIY
jgi:hypothetical protein